MHHLQTLRDKNSRMHSVCMLPLHCPCTACAVLALPVLPLHCLCGPYMPVPSLHCLCRPCTACAALALPVRSLHAAARLKPGIACAAWLCLHCCACIAVLALLCLHCCAPAWHAARRRSSPTATPATLPQNLFASVPCCVPRSYCKPQHAFYDLAADVIAESPQYVAQFLNKDMQDYLQATILKQVRSA